MAIKRYKGRKSLKQPDEFVTFSSKLLKQIVLHRNKVISVLGGIVVIGLIIIGANYLSKKAETNAFLMLDKAVNQYESVKKKKSPVEAYEAVKNDLEEIADIYGNKMGGKLAIFFLANSCFDAGEYSQAETLYREAAKKLSGNVPFEYLAKSSLGYTLEQQGKYEEAAAIFSEMPSDKDSLMGDESLLALCRQYEHMGKTDLQLETAKKLIDTFPQSVYINLLKEKFPGIELPES